MLNLTQPRFPSDELLRCVRNHVISKYKMLPKEILVTIFGFCSVTLVRKAATANRLFREASLLALRDKDRWAWHLWQSHVICERTARWAWKHVDAITQTHYDGNIPTPGRFTARLRTGNLNYDVVRAVLLVGKRITKFQWVSGNFSSEPVRYEPTPFRRTFHLSRDMVLVQLPHPVPVGKLFYHDQFLIVNADVLTSVQICTNALPVRQNQLPERVPLLDGRHMRVAGGMACGAMAHLIT